MVWIEAGDKLWMYKHKSMTVLLVSSDGSSLAVPTLSDARPVASHVHHVASVEYSVAE